MRLKNYISFNPFLKLKPVWCADCSCIHPCFEVDSPTVKEICNFVLFSSPQDPDVITVTLPVEYGPMPEEEERVRPDDPAAPSLLVSPQDTEDSSTTATSTRSEDAKKAAEALLMSSHPSDTKPSSSSTYSHPPMPSVSAPPACGKPSPANPTAQDGGHVNLGFAQASLAEKKSHGGKPTNLWNPTYGSWFLQQQQKRQQAQAQAKAQRQLAAQGHEHPGRTVTIAEALSQHKQKQIQQQQKIQQQKMQFQQQQQQQMQIQQMQIQQQQIQQQKIQQQQQQIQMQQQCRPLLPPPPPAAAAPLLLDSAALPPVPLYRLRRFPCGNIGYGYQEQGLHLDTSVSGSQNPLPPPALSNQQRPISLSRTGGAEDSRPLLVTMGTVQDSRLPNMEGHNATVL